MKVSSGKNGSTDIIVTVGPATQEGKHMAFLKIEMKDSLPASMTAFGYQSGFRGLGDLPPISSCIKFSWVRIDWGRESGTAVPVRIEGELYPLSPAGTGISSLRFDARNKFSFPDSVEFEKMSEKWAPHLETVKKLQPDPEQVPEESIEQKTSPPPKN
jgi:hypothetical protein